MSALLFAFTLATCVLAHVETPQDDWRGRWPPPCGPTSVAIVQRLLGGEVENDELVGMVNPDGSTELGAMLKYFVEKGFSASAILLTPSDLEKIEGVAILHLLPKSHNSGSQSHYVVFCGLSPHRKLYILDPTPGSKTSGEVDADAFLNRWSGKALVVSRPPLRGANLAGKAFLWVGAPLIAPTALLLRLGRKNLVRDRACNPDCVH